MFFSPSGQHKCVISCNHAGIQTSHSAINANYSVDQKHGGKITADQLVTLLSNDSFTHNHAQEKNIRHNLCDCGAGLEPQG